MWQASHVGSYSTMKAWKSFLWDQEQDKDAYSCHLFSIVLEILATAIRPQEEMRHANHKGRSKNNFIYGWCNYIHTHIKILTLTARTPQRNRTIKFSKAGRYKINIQKFNASGLEERILLEGPVIQSSLQSQCHPYQNSNGICHRNRTEFFTGERIISPINGIWKTWQDM